MRNFQRNKKYRYYFRSKPVLILLSLIVILFAWKIIVLVGKMKNTYRNKEIEQSKIIDLQKRKQKLLSDIDKLNTDKGKEEVIRENYGMARDGEGIVVIVDDKNEKETETKSADSGFLSFFKNIFGK